MGMERCVLSHEWKMFEDVPLPDEAIAYVKQHLTDGHTFARHLASVIDVPSAIYTIVPEGVESDALKNFSTGGKLAQPPRSMWRFGVDSVAVPIPNTDDVLAEKIVEFVTGHARRVCVFENFNAKPHYPYLANLSNLLVFGEEVYHVVRGGDSIEEL